MRNWGIGINNYYYTSSIYLDEASWYIFAIENIIQNICHYFPRIPLPKIKIIRENEETNLKEYYGTIADLFHLFICDPISQWCFRKTESKYFEFPYLLLKEQYPKSFEDDYLYDEDDKEDIQERKENEKHSKIVGEEFNIVYKKLKKISSVRMEGLEK